MKHARIAAQFALGTALLLVGPAMGQDGAAPAPARQQRPGLYKGVHSAAELRKVSGLTDPAANAYADLAAQIGAAEWAEPLEFRCRAKWQTVSHGMGPPPPTKLFDNLWYIGTDDVSSHLLITSAGLIVIDTMNNASDVDNIIIPDLKKIGLNAKDIKYILITHEHGDHFGGVNELSSLAPDAKVGMSQVAWDAMSAPTPKNQPAGWNDLRPKKRPNDLVIGDGMKITLGDTTITAYLTPGHTPGTTSFIIPTHEGSVNHMVAEFGGSGVPEGLEKRIIFRKGLDHFQDATDEAGADSEITVHNVSDDGMRRLALERARKPGDPNPYVLGRDGYIRYASLYRYCASASIAQSVADEKK